jgi:hypothetical protein
LSPKEIRKWLLVVEAIKNSFPITRTSSVTIQRNLFNAIWDFFLLNEKMF